MNSSQLNTPQPSDIKILDNLLALNLNISLWSARKKLTQQDFWGAELSNVELPPEDLATLGSKRIAPPESLRIFGALKARAFNFLDRHGIRFMSGWAIPEDKAGEIIQELMLIRDEFMAAKAQFLVEYDKIIQDWIAKHADWGNIIADSVVSPDYVRSRLDFAWQMYKVAPLIHHDDNQAVLHAGLAEEVENLGNTLFNEVSRTANDIWNRVYAGKTEVTHKALSPLRTLHNKLLGLSFVEPHVMPVAEIIAMALQRIPKKGNINGNDLSMLQGIVCLLRDTKALLSHAQQVISGYGPATVLDAVLADANNLVSQPMNCTNLPETEENTEAEENAEAEDNFDVPSFRDDPKSKAGLKLPPPSPVVNIPSLGLW